MLQPDEVDYVIYHSPCTDGTGSGLVAWKYLSEKFPDKYVTYKPMPIGAPPPNDIEGKNVLICDYSYRKDIIADLLTKVNKFLIIDHHKTAEKDLLELDNKYKIFDMSHSGAVLTWNYFYPNTKMPLFFSYIEDNDIWKKALPKTNNFSSAIYILPHEFPVYAKYLDDTLLLDLINNTGEKYNELNEYYTNHSADYAVPKFCKIKGKFYFVGYVNTTVLKSDIGNKIFDKLPLIDFSVGYSINDNSDGTSLSLRSTNEHVDVSKIAFKFSAGGHRNASGMRLEYVTNTIPGKVYGNSEIYKLLENVYFNDLQLDNEVLNIIYLHSTMYKHQLGQYFLQTKSKIQNQKVKVANFLEKKVKCIEEVKPYHLSAIWSYNPVLDTSNYTITFDKKLNTEIKDKFIKLTSQQQVTVEFIEDRSMKVVYPGLVKKIDL